MSSLSPAALNEAFHDVAKHIAPAAWGTTYSTVMFGLKPYSVIIQN